jgi:predicted DNA-binding protein (UPF0251 family)
VERGSADDEEHRAAGRRAVAGAVGSANGQAVAAAAERPAADPAAEPDAVGTCAARAPEGRDGTAPAARNAIIDHYRSRDSARETPAEPNDLVTRIDAGGDPDQDRDADGARQELARCLAPLIRRLSEPSREALTLTDLGNLSQVDAAEAVGLSVSGMKARVQRARAQVHELLTACCEVALDDTRHITEVRRTGPCACPPASPK